MTAVVQVTPNLDIPVPEAWEGRAACKGADPGVFFPPKGASAAPAKLICAGCTVRAECLDFASRHSGRYEDSFGSWGIWGGTLERERRALRSRRRAAA